ncbi:MAG: murein L,D-transpeptidase [Allosphingosinicella sp.]|uniref:L,D-transpeptidase family protein n=1 Tax=Allosphingosinicella sp. TaxID=2823234 RepID=UPI00395408B1
MRNDPGTGRRRALAFLGWGAAILSSAALPMEGVAFAQSGGGGVPAALRSAAGSDRDLNAFYRARSHRPVWVRGGALVPEAERLAHHIADAALDGLDPADYRAAALLAAVEDARDGNAAALARAEAALSRAFASYVRDLHKPSDVGVIYVDRELKPRQPTRKELLDALGAATSLSALLDHKLTVNRHYAELRAAYADWRARWGDLPDVRVPTGPTLSSGATGERVRLLRQRLGLAPGNRFDGDVAQKLRAWKVAHGLPREPVADAATIAALNRGQVHHERLIRANLERARALPSDLGRRYVLVDAAAARLWLYEDGRPVDSMRVVVGKKSDQTPMMAAFIRHVTFSPYWNVPPDLVERRIAPNVLSQGLSYLRNARYEVFSSWEDDAVRVDPTTVDWAAVASGRKELPVRQLPGRGNAMGDMKFMLPNQHGIYLHDTPDRNLFGQDDRLQSSGCVRVEDARKLARWLFGRNVRASGEPEQNVPLPEPVPVYITYLTVAPAENGALAFRSDVYDRDRVLLARLGGGPSEGAR